MPLWKDDRLLTLCLRRMTFYPRLRPEADDVDKACQNVVCGVVVSFICLLRDRQFRFLRKSDRILRHIHLPQLEPRIGEAAESMGEVNTQDSYGLGSSLLSATVHCHP